MDELQKSISNKADTSLVTSLQETVGNKVYKDARDLVEKKDIQAWQNKLGDGKIDVDNAGLVTGGTVFEALQSRVKSDGSNVTDSATWAEKLGKGAVLENNTGLVKGGVVYEAIKDKVDKSELSDYAKLTDLDGKANTDAKNISGTNLQAWQNKLGDGKIDADNTGLVTGGTVYAKVDELQKSINNKADTSLVTSLQETVGKKVSKDASELVEEKDIKAWQGKLGDGKIEANNVGLVTGGIVYAKVNELQKSINNKADTSMVTELQTIVGKKADSSALLTLQKTVDSKADTTTVNLLQHDVGEHTIKLDTLSSKVNTNTTNISLKANVNADNLGTDGLKAWRDKLGGGVISDKELGFVTGATVYAKVNELQASIDKKVSKDANELTDPEDIQKWQRKLGIEDSTHPLTNVVTGFNIAAGSTTNAFKFGKGQDHTLTFKGTDNETVVSMDKNDSSPTVTIGLADTFTSRLAKLEKDVKNVTTAGTSSTSAELAGKADVDAKNVTDSAAWAKKLGTGKIDVNSTELVTGEKVYKAVENKAFKNAGNLNPEDIKAWRGKLGGGSVGKDNAELVTGGAVYTALGSKADLTGENVTNPGTWGKKLGSGQILEDNGELVTGGTVYHGLSGKVNVKADNLTDPDDIKAWRSKLGGGVIGEKDPGLVTGGTVWAALQPVAMKDGSNITNPATWASKLGTGKVELGNTDLVTGGVVHAALNAKANQADLTALKNIVDGKASADGSNAENPETWAQHIAKGEVASGNTGIVTGGAVYTKVSELRASINNKADKSLVTSLQEAVGQKADKSDVTDLGTKIDNIVSGTTAINLTRNSTVKELQSKKANVKGDNIDSDAWADKLGTGEVSENSNQLVKGSTVFNALDGKANADAKNIKGTNLQAWQKKLGDGKIADKNTGLVTGGTVYAKVDELQASIDTKVSKDAGNLVDTDISSWRGKLGGGKIEANNAGLVTGGTVYTALQGKADRTELDGYAKKGADNIDVSVWQQKLGISDTTHPLTNVATEFNITAGSTTKAFKFGKGQDHTLTFKGTDNETVVSMDKNDSSLTVKIGLADTFKSKLTQLEKDMKDVTGGTSGTSVGLAGKADQDAKNISGTNLQAWQKKLGDGKIADKNTGLVTGGTVHTALQGKADINTVNNLQRLIALNTGNVAKKADKDAGNLVDTDISSWRGKLGGGKIEANNAGLVTGGTVYTALQGKADRTELDGYAKKGADNIDVSVWQQKLGISDTTHPLTNVATEFNITAGSTTKAFKFGKGQDHTLTFKGTDNETVVSMDKNNSSPTVTIGLADTFKSKLTQLESKADLSATNLKDADIQAWKKKLGIEDSTHPLTNVATGFNITAGSTTNAFKFGKGQDHTLTFKGTDNETVVSMDKNDSSPTVTIGLADTFKSKLTQLENDMKNVTKTSQPALTFNGTNGITAEVVGTQVNLGINWNDVNAPKFHIYGSPAPKARRTRSAGYIPGPVIGTMNFNELNMVFGKGLTADVKTGDDGKTYTVVSLDKSGGLADFTVKTDETASKGTFTVRPGENTSYLKVAGDGKNISTSVDKDNTVKVSLKDDVSIKSLTATTITTDTVKLGTVKGKEKVYLDEKGIHANDQVISDVKAGEKDSDAVNVAQLKALAEHTGKISRAVGKLAVESRNGDALNAALSALHPLDYDPENKFDISAGYGTYKGIHAVALGTFYRPNANMLLSVGGSFSGSDSMLNAGVSFKLGSGTSQTSLMSKRAMTSLLERLGAENAAMKDVLAKQEARTQMEMGALQKENSSLKDKVKKLEQKNNDANSLIEKANDRIEKANDRIDELERKLKMVLDSVQKK